MNYRVRLRNSLLVAGVLVGHTLLAQTPADAERRYKAAVRQVQIGQYEPAKAELAAIAQRGDKLAPFAQYHYAIATFRQRNYAQVRTALKQLLERYPNWQQIDEAHYLYASASMEVGQYEDALTHLQRIKDPDLRTDVDKVERYFLARLTDPNRLKQLQRQFPDNRNVAVALIDRLRSSTRTDELELANRLAKRFNVPAVSAATTSGVASAENRPGAPKPAPNRNRPKDTYNVAVLFPFRLDDFSSGGRSRNNQYVYDLYEGMQLAQAKLQSEGITLNVAVFDLNNDVAKTQELLNNPAFAQQDLIFGPLYAEPNRLVTAFAGQQGLVLVNPIATGSELIAGQPLAFLAQPSLNQQAEKAFAFARAQTVSRRVAVYFGSARKDSLLALAYQNVVKKNGLQVVDARKLTGDATAMAALMQLTEANKPGHVFFASSNDDDGKRMLSALGRKGVRVPLIATSSAFDYYRDNLSTFNRRDLYLLYPDYIDTTRPAVEQFQEQYLNTRNIIPSVFAAQGYDMMLFFGRMLARNGGSQLRNRTTLVSDTDDYVLSGFDYTRSNENAVVPIVRYEGGRFVKLN